MNIEKLFQSCLQRRLFIPSQQIHLCKVQKGEDTDLCGCAELPHPSEAEGLCLLAYHLSSLAGSLSELTY